MNKTRHRKLELVKGNVLVIGVDVGKRNHHAGFRLPGGEVVKVIKIRNNREGFERLMRKAKELCEEHKLTRMVLGIEPTGHYWEALAYWWEEKQGVVVFVSPLHTKRAKEMEDNSPLKSDEKDARVIAGLVGEGKFLECHLPRGVFAELRNLVLQRERCQKDRTQAANQLNQTVDRLFPELAELFSKLTSNTCLQLLLAYPSPEQLAKIPVEELAGILRRWSRGRFGRARGEELIKAAGNSVGVKEGSSIMIEELRRLIRLLELLGEQCREIEENMEKRLDQTPGAKLLLTVKGFGPVTVASILANTGDLNGYGHPDEVIKLAGLNLFEISSGKKKGKLRISKRGRSQLRKILYLASLRAVARPGPFKEYYTRLVDRGAEKIQALVAVMRKLLRVVWSMVHNNKAFDPERVNCDQRLAMKAA